MQLTDRIRPGAALEDENLRAGLQERLAKLEIAAISGKSLDRIALNVGHHTWSVLAAYPWQRYNYRYGRWQADGILWRALITFDVWESYKWRPNHDSFQLLDPYSGQRIGEFISDAEFKRDGTLSHELPDVIAAPGGTLEFAGNPASIGVYRPTGGSADTVRYSCNPWGHPGNTIASLERLRTGEADELPPTYPTPDLDLLDAARVWFAQSPDKPRKKPDWKASYRAFHYRPGNGLPHFVRPRRKDAGQ